MALDIELLPWLDLWQLLTFVTVLQEEYGSLHCYH